MLDTVAAVIAESSGTVTMAELSRRTGVAISALRPMVELLTRKGLLTDAGPERTAECSDGGCGMTCSPEACPFLLRMPRTLELRTVPSRESSP